MAKNNYTKNQPILNKLEFNKPSIEKVEETIEIVEIDEIKTIERQCLDVEDNAIMIMVGDWVRRVYFDLSWNDRAKWLEHKKHYKGRNFTINYVGDFNDAHTVKLLPIKSI